ncbi:hypothetical protein [Elizabethkingia meningoseptica]|uniref:COG1470 family protein n=1 Tax=Elizabethkingia meningoseptica TaxID=238 RepID=UPI0023B09DFF|nr:hypothetical protein [Elizabethkingia meningoseptica]MDE5431002.1 hypothetical protein [Elizabethkingia meningoseptica]
MIKSWILYLIILFPALLFSQKQPQEVIHKKDSLVPGTVTSVSFPLENNTSEDRIYTISIQVSNPYITPVIAKNEIKIPAGQSSLYLVPLRIATETPQGTYTLSLHGTEKNGAGDNRFIKTSKIIISKVRKLSLTNLNAPEFVKAGESVKASFLLKNNGNTTEYITLENSQNSVIDQDKSVMLPPGESRIISVSKNTDPALGRNDYLNLKLSAHAANYSEENLTAYTSTRVISIQPVDEDVYHRFPVSASVAFIGMRNRGIYQSGFQGELYGKGSLDKGNKNMLEFRAVSKNPVDFSSFTQYEEYFINYKRNNLFFHLGDKTFYSSFLTEYARYGRGAEVRYDFKNVSIGGFYNRPRFFRDIKEEFNLFTKFRFGKETELTAGYLYKNPQPGEQNYNTHTTIPESKTYLPYLSGKFRLFKNIGIQAETAYSKAGSTEGTAYMVQAQGNFEKINGNIMYMKASPQFAGYFNNTNTLNGNIQYRITDKFNVFASYIQDAKNFRRDTLLLASPYRKFFQYGINYRYMKTGSVMFYNGYQKYEDRLEHKQFNYNEKFFKVSIDQKIGIFQLNVDGQFGRTDNYLTGFTGNSSFYTANLSFEKFKTSFNLYGSYGHTSRYLQENQKQIYYGARVTSRFSTSNYLSIFYQNNYIPEEYFKDRNLFEVLFHQQISRNHEFDVSGRYTLQRGELGDKDFIFSLRYTLRMNIPVQKIAEYTTLSGNISNMGVRKTEGIRLMLGKHLSIADKSGNFIFKNIPPGDYFLEVDRSTTEINDIPNVNFPAALNLTRKDNIYNFGLTSASAIKGNVQFNEIDTNRQPFENKKKESIVVEASNGEQIFRKIVSINENFDFTYLQPGNWIVKLYRNGLDKRYKIATDTFNFTLKPAETKTISIHIIKQQTEIRYQQEAIKVEYHVTRKLK